jgi:CheY-like chemotaxis protein
VDSEARILVVEDEQIVAMDMQSQLRMLRYEVVGIASTGRETFSLIEKTRPDLVLMDIQLHGNVDGIKAADQIRQQWQIPVVFVTAFAGRETLARATAAGAYGYITKPFKAKIFKPRLT